MRAKLIFCTGVVAAGLFSATAGQLPAKHNYVLTDKDAYILLLPEVVCGPIVRRSEWSKDGRYLAIVRESNPFTTDVLKGISAGAPIHGPMETETSLLVWNMRTRKSVEVWNCPSEQGGIEAIQWLSDSSIAFLRIWRNQPSRHSPGQTQRVNSLIRLNAALGQLKVLAQFREHDFWQLHASAKRPYAILQQTQTVRRQVAETDGTIRVVTNNPYFLRLLRENGTLGPPIPQPYGHGMEIRWPREGDGAVLRILDREATNKLQTEKQRTGIAVWRWFLLDPQTGTSTALTKAPALSLPPETLPVRLKSGVVTAREGETNARIPLLWLEGAADSPHPRALVAANVDEAWISPSAGGILQVSRGAAVVTPLLKMSRELFARMQEQALKAIAMSNAKQLGLGIRMYTQDYDELFPYPDGINDLVQPYVKNAALFDGFVYEFHGGSLNQDAKPAETELGYVNGPGGRAIIFGDGHVVWRPD